MLKNKVAQLTVVGLLMIFLTIMVLAALMPIINEVVDDIGDDFDNNSQTYESILTRFIPMFIIIVLLATIALYAGPQIGMR